MGWRVEDGGWYVDRLCIHALSCRVVALLHLVGKDIQRLMTAISQELCADLQ